mmetsp:Transcript_32353/g.86739  ORF Transcript_32353/g.86739 Transcript_32353/m.86739 type:complete len:244 (-) Transcript_32353:2226-2957(-)
MALRSGLSFMKCAITQPSSSASGLYVHPPQQESEPSLSSCVATSRQHSGACSGFTRCVWSSLPDSFESSYLTIKISLAPFSSHSSTGGSGLRSVGLCGGVTECLASMPKSKPVFTNHLCFCTARDPENPKRLSTAGVSRRLTKSFADSDNLLNNAIGKGCRCNRNMFSRISLCSPSPFDSNGGWPENSSNATMPKAHQSTPKPYPWIRFFPSSSSGAMYSAVPQHVCVLSNMSLAKPMSQILT